MEINIKHECQYEYKISLKVSEYDFIKITKIITNKIVFHVLGTKKYLVEINIIQLTDILKYLLLKLDSIEYLEKTLDKYSNN